MDSGDIGCACLLSLCVQWAYMRHLSLPVHAPICKMSAKQILQYLKFEPNLFITRILLLQNPILQGLSKLNHGVLRPIFFFNGN